MKTWELIKHLEDGGKITYIDTEECKGEDKAIFSKEDLTILFDDIAYSLDIFYKPEKFEIVKPKKKIQLYRYTYNEGEYHSQSDWIDTSFERWRALRFDDYFMGKLIKTETKEEEVDDVD